MGHTLIADADGSFPLVAVAS